MSRLLRGLALFTLLTSVIWVAVLWRWQATARDMTTRDIAVYLVLLPLTVFAIALLGRWAWRGFVEREAQRGTTGAAAGGATGSGAGAAAAGADEAERHATVQLLAARVNTAAASSPADLAAAGKAGSPRPALDPELRDEDGLPILTARIADIDAGLVEEEAEAALASLVAARPEWAGSRIPDHVWRALAALRLPLADAVEALAPWAPMLADVPATTAAAQAATADGRSLRVLLGWPLGWTELEQALARAVAVEWLAQSGARALPGVRFGVAAEAVAGTELLLQADRLLQTLVRAGHAEPVIVAACHSGIGDDAVAALEREGLLHQPQRRPKGQMPAEAAAALVFANAAWPAAEDADGPVPHLHRPAVVRRDKSIDAPGRVGPQTAAQAMTSALAASRLQAEAVAGLVGDADQHTERAAEFFTAASETLPQLDAGEDLCAIGHVTGAVGAVGPLLVVACAAAVAASTGKPCMALGVGDAFARFSLVALPGAPALPGKAPAVAAAA